jgi:hypothetical protein
MPFVKLTISKNPVTIPSMFHFFFKRINQVIRPVYKSVISVVIIFIFAISLININIYAAACPPTDTISLTDIFQFAKFLPVIPKACSDKALDLQDLGTVLLRLWGFLASLIWYLVSFIVIFSGMMWIWDGIDGNQAAQAKKNLVDSVYALLIVFSTFIIINTVLSLIGGTNLTTGLGKFFK